MWALDDNFDRWPDADALLSDPAARAVVSGVAFHCYSGDVSALREIRDRHPGVPVAVSECSGGAWSPEFARELRYDAHTMIVHAIRNGAAWLVEVEPRPGPAGRPHNGGCPSAGTGQPGPVHRHGHAQRDVLRVGGTWAGSSGRTPE